MSETAEPSVEEILAQMEAAEKAPEPGTLKRSDIIHRGDDEVPVPIRAAALKSAGYRYIYDRVTGQRSNTNVNMLPSQLKKKHPDGSLVFTTVNPKIAPKAGKHKCPLHAELPERGLYDGMGLPVCRKANLVNEHQVELHMKHRHPTAYAAIKDLKDRAEKAEDRALQRETLAAMTALVAQAAPKGKTEKAA
jgi:hypothetical protein